MTETQLIDRMIAEYHEKRNRYESMENYYKGDHDINRTYNKYPYRANQIVTDNFVNKFINEEVQYSLGNPLSVVSLSGNDDIVKTIYNTMYHWKDYHNQELMRTLEIFGTAYLLNYIDSHGRFSERILSPKNSIVYTDPDGVPLRFIHFYKLKYDENEYRDIYYPDGRIMIYQGNTLISQKNQPFAGIPVSICKLKNIEDTIYFKIKSLQDAYNEVLSDQVNTIADFRSAYLVIGGVQVDDKIAETLRTKSILNLPANNTYAKYLIKDIPDGYIQNSLQRLRNSMYETCNHVDGNEKLQSNTSGTALRNRLVFLEQRCNMMLEIILNSIYERIERLLEYIETKGIIHPIEDIKITSSPCIPQDEITLIQGLVQLGIGENISLETALSRLPFIENPSQEIEKIKAEKQDNQKIELDKIDSFE